jgi:hypothetical protein
MLGTLGTDLGLNIDPNLDCFPHTHKPTIKLRMSQAFEPSPSTASVCTSGVYMLTQTPEREHTRSGQLLDAISRELRGGGWCSAALTRIFNHGATTLLCNKKCQASRINVWNIAFGTTGTIGDEVRY